MRTLFTFVFPTTQLGPLHRVNSFRVGSITRTDTRHCYFLMLRMKPMFRSRVFRTPFSKFLARASARSNCAVFPRTAVSPACVAGLRLCQNQYSHERRTAAAFLFTHFGSGVGARKRTA